jgi:hypothetical protein
MHMSFSDNSALKFPAMLAVQDAQILSFKTVY